MLVETRQTRILLLVTIVIAVMGGLFIAVAFTTGSVSLIGESFRWIFLIAYQFYIFFFYYLLSQDQSPRFEYGTGKFEQLVYVALGAGLLAGSFWMIDLIFQVSFGTRDAAQPAELAFAALVNAVGLLVHLVSLAVMWRLPWKQTSFGFEAHLNSRAMMLAESVGLHIPLTAAALARDAGVGVAFDLLGAAYVTILMFRHGLKLLVRSLPHLVDAPASDDIQRRIAEIVGSLLPVENVVDIRTRLNGQAIEVEIAMEGTSCRSAADLCQKTTAIEEALVAEEPGMEVFVIFPRQVGPRETPSLERR